MKDKELDQYPYVIARTKTAGVFAGYLFQKQEQEVILLNARRIWYWEGAASLSQLAVTGTSLPERCKFPIAVTKVILTEVTEICYCSEQGQKSIQNVPIWKF